MFILIDPCSSYSGTIHIRIVKDSGQDCSLRKYYICRSIDLFKRYKTRYFWVIEKMDSLATS